MTSPALPDSAIARIRALLADGQRKLLGLIGPPAAGKSTLSQALGAAFPGVSSVVPMDGYHLAQVELERLGRAARKGAPDTFDSAGYAALLRRLRTQRPGEIVYAPDFRREIEEPVAGAIPVFPETQLVITEGNYLLLDSDHWPEAAAQLDEVWYVAIDDDLRNERLLARHMHFGRSRDAALAWMAATDTPNAVLIASTQGRAHYTFRWE